jgi:hypothetical protein
MTNSDINPFSNSLVYEDMLPLSWCVRGQGEQFLNHARVAEHNEHVMRCVNLLGEQIYDKLDEESETDSALIRLEAKINLILEMVSNLDRDSIDLPDATQVKLAAGGIEWRCQGTPPGEGDDILVSLYVDNRIPEAMKLAAKVLTVDDDGSGTVVCARFEEMGEAVTDQMEKMIFRNHRRLVAQSKSG